MFKDPMRSPVVREPGARLARRPTRSLRRSRRRSRTRTRYTSPVHASGRHGFPIRYLRAAPRPIRSRRRGTLKAAPRPGRALADPLARPRGCRRLVRRRDPAPRADLAAHAEPAADPARAPPRARGAGVALRLALELFLFRSLARASPATWLPAILFHYGLLLVLIVHLRFLFPTFPPWLLPFLRASGWATLALVAGLAWLLARRVAVDRVRRISAPSDYLHVVLLLAIALTGTALKRWWPTELHAVGEFVRGALTFDWQALPAHAGLIAHLVAALALLLCVPDLQARARPRHRLRPDLPPARPERSEAARVAPGRP